MGRKVPQIGERRGITIHCPRVISSSSGMDRVRSQGVQKHWAVLFLLTQEASFGIVTL